MRITVLRALPALLLLVGPAATAVAPDADGDGIHDYMDNCLLVPNRDQSNTDRAVEPQGGPGPLGNACDCDFDNDGACGIADFNLFLPDFLGGADSGVGSDMDGSPGVGIGDFNLFLAGFLAGVPGPGAAPAAVVEGSCDPATDSACNDPFRPGACFDLRVGADEVGGERPWAIRAEADGCPIDPQVLIDAGFAAAATNPNNPTDAWLRNQSAGQTSCPHAAFATFPSAQVCDPSVPCDPRDHGRKCGAPNNRGGIVSCGDAVAPLACETLSLCGSQCGYRGTDCIAQLHRNLVATCDALAGRERIECRPACLGFADLYADALAAVDPGPGNWSTTDLADEARLCRCGTEAILGQPPSICGDGVCESLSESCQSTSCPADCGPCGLGDGCLIDSDCGLGICSPQGVCALGWGGASCDEDADCTSGACLGGQCTSLCGDGFCDGTELCGASNLGLACNSDCGKCGNGKVCASNSTCASNACNFGFCVGYHSLGRGTPCTTSNACSSGTCFFGFCT